MHRDPARRAFVAALKAGLIAADAVASGLVREGHDLLTWLDATLHLPPLDAAALRAAVLAPRVAALAAARSTPFTWHAFQDAAALQPPRTLLLAACGAGKTLAAWRWAEAQLARRPAGRVIFLYPTRGTATEGFRDYVGWAPEAEAALVHGTARFDLEGMADNPSDATTGKRYAPSESEARLFALAHWSRRYFSATVDQFLGFLEHAYASLALLPALADAVLVIDEVHSFDRHMFDALVNFLRHFDLPVLCMTATLPPSRQQELRAAGLALYPDEADRPALADLDALERHPRYALTRLDGEADALAHVLAAYRGGLRVLWVVNVVARAQRLARALEATLGVEVLCYHSRFRLEDRRRVHAATVAAFQGRALPRIAVTTQVCEMSLDLDADVLVTELAPFPSLVQRLGRANRHLARGDAYRAPAYVYAPESPAPYLRDELDRAAAALAPLTAAPVSQRDLALALERADAAEPRAADAARFLDAGYFATPGAFRDGEDHGRPVVLDDDLPAAARAHAEGRLEAFVLTVPARAVLDDLPRPGWLPRHLGLAASAHYDPRFGFDPTTGGAP